MKTPRTRIADIIGVDHGVTARMEAAATVLNQEVRRWRNRGRTRITDMLPPPSEEEVERAFDILGIYGGKSEHEIVASQRTIRENARHIDTYFEQNPGTRLTVAGLRKVASGR
jgi:hypothetical protein